MWSSHVVISRADPPVSGVASNGRQPVERSEDAATIVPEPAGLATAVLDMDEQRRSSEHGGEEVLFADDLLPGVGTGNVTSRWPAKGGQSDPDRAGPLVLARSAVQLGVERARAEYPRHTARQQRRDRVHRICPPGGSWYSSALPMGWLADRFRRPPIIAWASLAFAGFLAVCGLAANAFMLFWSELGVEVSKANTISVQWSLIADQYPIGVRGRISAALNFGTQSATAVSPVLMAGVATLAGGAAGWRWSFIVLAVPVAIVAIFAFRLPSPFVVNTRRPASWGRSLTIRTRHRSRSRPRYPDPSYQDTHVGHHRLCCLGFRTFHGAGPEQPLPAAAVPPRHLLPGSHCDHRHVMRTGGPSFHRATLRPALRERSLQSGGAARHHDHARRHPDAHSILHA